MERITYRKTLDVHKNGIQFMLQGFQTADKISRVIEISLMASGDAIDFPLESITAVMYVTTPGTEKTSVNECTIKDNKVVYDVLPIVEEGITTMQLKIIETSPEGATSVLASPKFAVEVSASDTNEEDAEQSVTFTALEDAIAKAKATYDKGCIGISLDSECIFYAHYNDGTYYETDILKKLFLNGNVELSKSYAMGGTGVRAGEDTDNSKYYSNVSRSESLNAKAIMENSEDILKEVRTHGVYTAFRVNFENGEVEYVSPSFKFNINSESGELEADGQSDNFENEISRVVLDWLKYKEIDINKLQHHSSQIKTLQETNEEYGGRLANLEDGVRPIELGGTGASTVEEALINLGIAEFQKPWNIDAHVGKISTSGKLSAEAPTNNNVDYGENSVDIYMKNSGKIYLHFDPYLSSSDYDDDDVKIGVVEIKKNKEKIAEFYYAENKDVLENGKNITNTLYDVYSSHHTTSGKTVWQNVELEVNKGDTITVIVKCKRNKANPNYADFKAIDLHLRANVETPYVYADLVEGVEKITEEEQEEL